MKLSIFTALLLSLISPTLATWHPTETETDTTFLTLTTLISATPDPTTTTTKTSTAPSPTPTSTHVVTATTTVPWDASAASAASAAAASAGSADVSGAALPPNAQTFTILVGGGSPAPPPPNTNPAQTSAASDANDDFIPDPNPELRPQGTRGKAGDCTSQMRLCVTDERVPTRTVYIAVAEAVTRRVDCGGCGSLKVHRRVCTEREDIGPMPTMTIAGATRTSTTIVCSPSLGRGGD